MHKYRSIALGSLLALTSCGGGSGYGGPPPPPPPPPPGPNVATLTVEAGPAQTINIPFITITVCAPSTSNCQTISGIEVDTASNGLRLMASVLNSSLRSALPQQMVAGTTIPVVECMQFADGYSWGPVVSADLTISSEKASNIPIQIIGSSSFAQVPSDCSSAGPQEDTVMSFGANGLIGVGVFQQDCGSACATGVIAGTYYECPTNGGGCIGIMEPTTLQVSNPVASFASDNNGVIVELPSVAAGGAAGATGALIFGIGTQSNNALGSATILATDPGAGTINVTFGGLQYRFSSIDSGSNAYYFADSSLTVCGAGTAPGFYCTPASISTTITTASNTQLAADFSTGDAASMIQANPGATALPELAGPMPSSQSQTFDFGLPYFYGRKVYVAIENTIAGGTAGPYLAY
jgi:hypothetical protein